MDERESLPADHFCESCIKWEQGIEATNSMCKGAGIGLSSHTHMHGHAHTHTERERRHRQIHTQIHTHMDTHTLYPLYKFALSCPSSSILSQTNASASRVYHCTLVTLLSYFSETMLNYSTDGLTHQDYAHIHMYCMCACTSQLVC